ncbi:hypothetical protein PAECIP111802_06715 [Paenibacillus allorhizosphaerae]|uniref:ABC transporter permease n=2 Tax=Paenibacillus allorhizosphaerae TaxID=2849866 RepID=A0ABN7TVL7_9BACL|nr:hypothetical protein PAECIP111802_06715 [Paenibacillus allorhizosphaerae]
MDVGQLWNRRTKQFLMEVRPYIGYALQSASLALVLVMLAGTYFYTRFLNQVPPEFPLLQVAALVLWPFLAVCPIRTYLKDADLMYLLPLETELAPYMQQAVRRAFLAQSLLLLAVWMILWPMYAVAAGSDTYRFIYVLAMLLIVKRVLLAVRWRELQLTERPPVILFTLLRFVASAGFAYALMNLPVSWSALSVSAGLLIYLAIGQLTGRRSLNWHGLLAAELKHRSFILRLLNLFIDVPGIHGRARARRAPRKLLNLAGGRRFAPDSTYGFLYSRIWLRSEWFGITVRLTLIGALLTAVSSGPLLPAGVILLFAGIAAVQLKELQQMYRHSDWSYIYPLPPGLQDRSARTVRFRIHVGAMVVLCLPGLWTLPNPFYALAAFAVGCLLSLWYHYRPSKSTQRNN